MRGSKVSRLFLPVLALSPTTLSTTYDSILVGHHLDGPTRVRELVSQECQSALQIEALGVFPMDGRGIRGRGLRKFLL